MSFAVLERMTELVTGITRNHSLKVKKGIPSTDFNTIWIPDVEKSFEGLNKGEELALYKGFSFHESAHVLYSRKEHILEIQKEYPDFPVIAMHILNIIEDSRVENLIANSHRGTLKYFRFLNDFLFEKSPTYDTLSPLEMFLQAFIDIAVCGRTKEIPDKEVKELLAKAKDILSPVRVSSDPDDSYKAAKKIIELISHLIEKYPDPKITYLKPESMPECENSERDSVEVEIDVHESEIEDETKDKYEEKEKIKKDTEKKDEESLEGESRYSSEEKKSETDSKTSTSVCPRGTHRTYTFLEEEEKEARELERKERRMRVLEPEEEDLTEYAPKSKIPLKVIKPKKEPELFKDIYETVKSKINVVERELRKTLRSQSDPSFDRRVGRLDKRKLYRLPMGEDRIFYKPKSEDSIGDIAFLLLIDCSGSMAGSKLKNAVLATTLFSEVLERLEIPFAVLGFTTDGYRGDHTLPVVSVRIKTFKEKYSSVKERITGIFNVYLADNHDPYSIKHASNYLSARPESRKVLVVLSDGEPLSSSHFIVGERGMELTNKAVREAISKGISTICISIDSSGAMNYLPEIYPHFILCPDIDQLINVFAKFLSKALL